MNSLNTKVGVLKVSLHNKQNGMTTISLALLLGLIAFFVLIALTLTPIYLENLNVAQKLKTLKKDPAIANMTDDEIMETLFKRFSIDNVDSVQAENVLINREGGTVHISVEYEVRKQMVGNIDVVVSFFDEVNL